MEDLMLVGISADIRRDEQGHFICEVFTDEIGEALAAAIKTEQDLRGPRVYSWDEPLAFSEEEDQHLADSIELLEVIDRTPNMRWTLT
jgi:hypothetical protein